MTRYLGDESHPEVFDGDGWFFTGDLAALDDGGRIAYLGRIKDMLKVGGENVSAARGRGPSGPPRRSTARWSALPTPGTARYRPLRGARPGLRRLTEADLIDFCRGQIATFKVPRYVRS